MAFTSLRVERFTAFGEADFALAPGVNALIGQNGTGKSHVLKLLYTLHEATRKYWSDPEGRRDFAAHLGEMLAQTFLPHEAQVGRLVRRALRGPKTCKVAASFGATGVGFTLTHRGTVTAPHPKDPSDFDHRAGRAAVFLPPREMLSLFPGFISDWEERESTYDRTYYDLCLLLGRSPLRGAREGERKRLLEPLEAALGGEIHTQGGRFFVRSDDGEIEMPLLAEGLRKVAQLAYLVLNGSLRARSVLLWDEPEANLNPEMSPLLAATVLGLARQGVQVVLATHDYAFASELSRQIETAAPGLPPCAFFSLRRDEAGQRQVERAEAFALLAHNPILDAMATLHDRELHDTGALPGP